MKGFETEEKPWEGTASVSECLRSHGEKNNLALKHVIEMGKWTRLWWKPQEAGLNSG